MKRQALTLTVIDRRYDPPKETVQRFKNHRQYLQAMAKAVAAGPGTHVVETTESRVELLPHHQGGLFT